MYIDGAADCCTQSLREGTASENAMGAPSVWQLAFDTVVARSGHALRAQLDMRAHARIE